MNTDGVDTRERVKVWDIVVRTFHWSLVAGFFLSYVSVIELTPLEFLDRLAVLIPPPMPGTAIDLRCAGRGVAGVVILFLEDGAARGELLV